jgi:hypothetical protein
MRAEKALRNGVSIALDKDVGSYVGQSREEFARMQRAESSKIMFIYGGQAGAR